MSTNPWKTVCGFRIPLRYTTKFHRPGTFFGVDGKIPFPLLFQIWIYWLRHIKIELNLISSFFSGFIGRSLGLNSQDYLVWYVLFIIFVTYAMLPLQLRWCMSTGLLTATLHIIIIAVSNRDDNTVNQKQKILSYYFK